MISGVTNVTPLLHLYHSPCCYRCHQGSILLYTMRPMQSSQEEFQQARRLWPRYMAHSSDPSSSSCPSCSTGSRLLSSYLPGDSTDSSFGEDDYNFDELTNSPLLSDDYGDIAFEYEADEHQKRYRKEVSIVMPLCRYSTVVISITYGCFKWILWF